MKKLLIIIIGLLPMLPAVALAQNQPALKTAAPKAKDPMEQMLDLSRPGAHHAVLGRFAGTWNFQDTKLSFVKGTLVRKPIFDGRFYSVVITGGKLPLPVADGKMKMDNYQCLQTEGYDNPRGKYVTTSLNNHIGSDIEFQTGTYDPQKKEFTYDWNSELITGQKTKDRRVMRLVDTNHYVEEYFELTAGKYVKVRELDYTRVTN